jgi:hypothetical protein
MGVSLVPDIPDQAVARRVEKIVDSNRKLDNPKARSQVPPRHRHRINHLRPQLVGELAELIGFQFAKVFGGLDGVEERSAVADCHVNTFL